MCVVVQYCENAEPEPVATPSTAGIELLGHNDAAPALQPRRILHRSMPLRRASPIRTTYQAATVRRSSRRKPAERHYPSMTRKARPHRRVFSY